MSDLQIIGVPLDLGAARRGVEMGPAALRLAGLADRLRALGHTVTDTGNLAVPERDTLLHSSDGPKFLAAITRVCQELAERTERAALAGHIPIVLGGDHSLAAGSVAGVARAVGQRRESLGLLWVDAHTDLHLPETSESRNVHGMPVSHLIGRGYPGLASLGGAGGAITPEAVVYIGLRSVDVAERRHLHEFGIKKVFSMQDIDRRGIGAVMDNAIAHLFADGRRPLYVSYDMDFVDPTHAPGVGTPVIGGASVREALFVAEALAETKAVVGCDLVETCTPLDERNRTAELGVSIVASVFGETILACP